MQGYLKYRSSYRARSLQSISPIQLWRQKEGKSYNKKRRRNPIPQGNGFKVMLSSVMFLCNLI